MTCVGTEDNASLDSETRYFVSESVPSGCAPGTLLVPGPGCYEIFLALESRRYDPLVYGFDTPGTARSSSCARCHRFTSTPLTTRLPWSTRCRELRPC